MLTLLPVTSKDCGWHGQSRVRPLGFHPSSQGRCVHTADSPRTFDPSRKSTAAIDPARKWTAWPSGSALSGPASNHDPRLGWIVELAYRGAGGRASATGAGGAKTPVMR